MENTDYCEQNVRRDVNIKGASGEGSEGNKEQGNRNGESDIIYRVAET